MQSNAELMPHTDDESGVQPRTTAAGLEAWLSGELPEAAAPIDDEEIPVAEVPAPVEDAPSLRAGNDDCAINAAEALTMAPGDAPQRLVGPDGAELVTDPERGCYYFESTSLKPLAVLLQQPANLWQPAYSQALSTARDNNDPQPLERLRWYAGLIATPGILSRRLNRKARYKLARWPQTEREFPRHFRIAKAMLNTAATPDDVATECGVPYEDVVDFINASHAADRLVDDSPAKPDATATPGRRARLMERLNRPLFAR